MFWQFFPFVLGYFSPTHNAHLSPSSSAAFHGILSTLAFATAELLMKVGDPSGHLGLPHSSKDIFWMVAPSRDPGQLRHLQASSCVWAERGMLGSSRFIRRPRELCSTKGSPRPAAFAQKTVISKGNYPLQVLLCTNEFRFCRKRLQVVVITSGLKPGIVWTQINAWNETCLGSKAAESACCEHSKVRWGLQTPGLFFSNTTVCL